MKKVVSIVFIILFFFSSSYASFKVSLKQYLEKNNIEDGPTQIYLLNRCSAVYTYASAILLETDKLNSKNFIEISNNLLFKAIELMIIEEEEKKLEQAQNKAEDIRKKMFDEYIIEGKKNWEKNKSHFKGSFISEDMLICSNLVEGED
tara:strand:- start:683 stop:1126 length:444 start_codon:yes stop_codon:yes gene_type:complete